MRDSDVGVSQRRRDQDPMSCHWGDKTVPTLIGIVERKDQHVQHCGGEQGPARNCGGGGQEAES